ncbi:MAG: inorganic phosphate transporter, partial [Cypionkella sp.]|nr:inorganic phosphate transporter [Cypionkella sp.]
MTNPPLPPANRWKTLDKDLARFSQLENAAAAIGRPMVAIGISFIFVVVCALAAFALAGHGSGTLIIVAAAVFGAYMALNIGANDVANNMGPAVG